MFTVIHSIPNDDNPLVILSVHAHLGSAKLAAAEAAHRFARDCDPPVAVVTLTDDLLDPHICATYCVDDDAFLVTPDIAALLATRCVLT
jgi:hypothetical protein